MPLIVPSVLVGTPLLLTVLALSLSGGRVEPDAAWVRVRWMWAAAVVVGALLAWLVAHHLDLGRGTMLVPAVMGLSVVTGVGLGETVVRPRQPAGPRTASLRTRRITDYLPRSLSAVTAVTAGVHLATLAVTTATASADDLGRAGRRIAAQCGDVASAASPYPGSFYSVPLAAVLVVIALAGLAAVTVVVRRPRGFAPDELRDDVLRRRSATRVVAATGAALAASHAGIAFFAGTALLRLDCHRAWMPPLGWGLLLSVPLALVLLGWFVGRVLAPGRLAAAAPKTPVGAR